MLALCVVLTGCGGAELRSPACDEGKPVVATGRIVLDASISAADVSGATVYVGEPTQVAPLAAAQGSDPETGFTRHGAAGDARGRCRVRTA